MNIQKIKELALANGFKLKEQASGNMDLNAYVYDFANAIEREAKAQAVPEQVLENNCMIGQAWFMRGTPVSALIKHAEKAYQAEVVAQNSKLEFGTDDNKHWFAHDVPFYGAVQIDLIEEHGLVEWDIHFNGCWQGPFDSKSECIKHLEECIAEEREAAQESAND